jgi:hypothetical protein
MSRLTLHTRELHLQAAGDSRRGDGIMSADSFGGPPVRSFTGSGPLGQSGGGSSKGEAPNLADYPDEPQYDLATIVQLVGVRPMTLWAWEQQLGIPRPERVGENSGGTVRRYSERDLVASIWLRDQILTGVPPAEAAAFLLAAQGGGERPGTAGHATGADPSRVSTTGPSNLWSGQSRTLPGGGSSSGPLVGDLSGPLSRPGESARSGSVTGEPSTSPWGASAGRSSGPLSGTNWPVQFAGQTSGSSVFPGSTTGSFGSGVRSSTTGSFGGGVRSSTTGSFGGGVRSSTTGGLGWTGARSGPGTGRELRSLVPPLVRAFMMFDTFTANRILDEALLVRQVEAVCLGLLQPALARVSELGTRHELNIPEERYAINYVRHRLATIFVHTPERYDGPAAIVACGPREMYDLSALMLATFWRRAGLQVVFLGVDIDGPALVQAVQKRRPRVVGVSIMSTQRLRALARVAREVTQMDPPAPLFTYSGAVFARHPDLKRKVNGVYLGDDPATATWQVLRLLGLDPAPASPGTPPPSVDQAG